MTLKVVQATEQDIPMLLKMGIAMHKESRCSQFSFNEKKLVNLFMDLITRSNGILFISKDDDIPVGMFFGVINKHFFGDSLQAFDLAFYVCPSYRGTKAAYLLIKKYISHCKLHKVDDICLGTSTNINIESVDMFYTGVGFKCVGKNYVW